MADLRIYPLDDPSHPRALVQALGGHLSVRARQRTEERQREQAAAAAAWERLRRCRGEPPTAIAPDAPDAPDPTVARRQAERDELAAWIARREQGGRR